MNEEDFEKIDIATGRLVEAHREMRKAFFDKIKEFEEENAKLNERIEKLEELLKECREFFYENLYDTKFHFSCGLGSNIKMESCMRSLGKLRIKINQVLGEDK